MELMQIIEATLKVFIVTSTIVILFSYILHKVKSNNNKKKEKLANDSVNNIENNPFYRESVKSEMISNQAYDQYTDMNQYNQSYQEPVYEEPQNIYNEQEEYYSGANEQQQQLVFQSNIPQSFYSSKKRFEVVNNDAYEGNSVRNNISKGKEFTWKDNSNFQPAPVMIKSDKNLYNYYSRGNFEPMHKLKLQSPSNY